MLRRPPYRNPLPAVWAEPRTGGHSALVWHDAMAMTYRVGTGEEVFSADGSLSALVLPSRASESVYVARMSLLQQSMEPDPDYRPEVTVTRRVRLSWTADTSPDLTAYVLYWDEGLGGSSVDVELALVAGQTSYTTYELESGTYQFALALRDSAGNESVGTPVTITVGAPPDAPTGVSITYSTVTRKATIEWTGGLARIRSNHLPGVGLLGGVVDPPMTTSDLGSYETSVLFEGDWQFDIRCVNDRGVESDPETVALSLVYGEGQLDETQPGPPMPTWVEAVPDAGGYIEVSVEPGGESDQIRVYADGSPVDTASTEYPLTTLMIGPFSHEQVVSITACAVNDATSYSPERESAQTEAVTAVTDAVAPAGDTTLTGEAIP